MRARSTRSAIMLVSTPRDCCLESSEEFSAVMRDCAESPVEFELDATAAISLRAQFISMTASVGANNPVAESTMVLGLASSCVTSYVFARSSLAPEKEISRCEVVL